MNSSLRPLQSEIIGCFGICNVCTFNVIQQKIPNRALSHLLRSIDGLTKNGVLNEVRPGIWRVDRTQIKEKITIAR